MKHLSFIWPEQSALMHYLGKATDRLSIVQMPVNVPIAVVLWQGAHGGLRIRSQMFDVADRLELGVLEFGVVRPEHLASSIDVVVQFGSARRIEKLVIAEHDVTAESGLRLTNERGQQIVVVAGVSPYSLAIRAPGYLDDFQPEYPLDSYQQVPIV